MTNGQRPLPTGWRWAQLGEVANYINGMAFKPEQWQQTGLPIIRIQNLTSPLVPFNCFGGQVEERYKVADGDLLISWSASLDAFIWNRGPAVLNQHIFKAIEHEDIVIRDYLYYAVREAMEEIRSQVHGATMRHIVRPEFEAIKIPLPPLVEQKRIAELLNAQLGTAQRARAGADVQLGMARRLASRCILEAFSDEHLNSWPRRALSDMCSLLPARSIASQGDTEVLAITTACLSESGFRPAGVKKARMRALDVPDSLVRIGEVLVARSNTPMLVGRVAMYAGEPAGVVASDLTIRLWPIGEIEPNYLAAYLSSLYLCGYWRQVSGGASGTMKKITREQLLGLTVPVPDFTEQRAIVHKLNMQMLGANRLLASLEAQGHGLELLPSSLIRTVIQGIV